MKIVRRLERTQREAPRPDRKTANIDDVNDVVLSQQWAPNTIFNL